VTVDEIWRHKSDEQLLAASEVLQEYNEAGRQAILGELQRRRDAGALVETYTVESTDPSDDDESAGNVLIRLWRGQVPLVRTFWIFGFTINLLLRALIILAVGVRPLLVLLSAVYLGYLSFIYVAIWRSAGRYRGATVWRTLARLSIVLTILGGIANVLLSP
jgi:hypothetical protein